MSFGQNLIFMLFQQIGLFISMTENSPCQGFTGTNKSWLYAWQCSTRWRGLSSGAYLLPGSGLKFNYLLPWEAACWEQIMDLRKGLMDLKYNLALAWLLRDRSPLPITTLEVIKDSPEFVTLASSRHLECTFPFPISDAFKGHIMYRHESCI